MGTSINTNLTSLGVQRLGDVNYLDRQRSCHFIASPAHASIALERMLDHP
jgi:hypothetical protein